MSQQEMVTLAVKVPPDVKREFRVAAAQRGESMSGRLRELVERDLD